MTPTSKQEIPKHKCIYYIPIEWKQGAVNALDVVGGYHYTLTQVSKLMCDCGATKIINREFRGTR